MVAFSDSSVNEVHLSPEGLEKTDTLFAVVQEKESLIITHTHTLSRLGFF